MIRAASLGNDLKLEFRNPARLLSRLVLYASIYALVRLAACVVAPSPLAQGIDAAESNFLIVRTNQPGACRLPRQAVGLKRAVQGGVTECWGLA